MKISIELTKDNNNSYPNGDLEILTYEDEIGFKISDSAREVRVSKEDFKAALRMFIE